MAGVGPRTGAALGNLVAGCLAKDPAGRPELSALLAAVTARAAAFPESAPGQFWPEPVAAVTARQAGPLPRGPPTRAAQHRRRRGQARCPAAGAPARPGRRTPTRRHCHGPPRSPRLAWPRPTRPRPLPATSATATTAPSTSAPATSPAASTSTSLIAITVCTDPAVGCTDLGASQYMEVRPKQILNSADGSGYVTYLVWSDWGGTQAQATGTEKIDNCDPNCAQGHYTSYPATVTLAGPAPYGTGLEAYSTIVIQAPTAPEGGTLTYTRDTVP